MGSQSDVGSIGLIAAEHLVSVRWSKMKLKHKSGTRLGSFRQRQLSSQPGREGATGRFLFWPMQGLRPRVMKSLNQMDASLMGLFAREFNIAAEWSVRA